MKIEADTLQEANEIMTQKHPELIPTTFIEVENCIVKDDFPVIGKCEVSGLSIFENDEYVSDKEGVMILKKYQ